MIAFGFEILGEENAGGSARGSGSGGGDPAAEVHDGEFVDQAGAGAGIEEAPGAHSEHETLRRYQTQLRPSRSLPCPPQSSTCSIASRQR